MKSTKDFQGVKQMNPSAKELADYKKQQELSEMRFNMEATQRVKSTALSAAKSSMDVKASTQQILERAVEFEKFLWGPANFPTQPKGKP